MIKFYEKILGVFYYLVWKIENPLMQYQMLNENEIVIQSMVLGFM